MRRFAATAFIAVELVGKIALLEFHSFRLAHTSHRMPKTPCNSSADGSNSTTTATTTARTTMTLPFF